MDLVVLHRPAACSGVQRRHEGRDRANVQWLVVALVMGAHDGKLAYLLTRVARFSLLYATTRWNADVWVGRLVV